MTTPAHPIYLDNHSTTRVDPAVLAKMLPYFSEHYGNASSVSHSMGSEAGKAVKNARLQVASCLGVPEKSVIFTSGATESNNIALLGVMRAAGSGSHFITNAAEHKAVLDPATALEKEGFDVTVLPVNEFGQVEPNQVSNAIRDDTALVSVMLGNNEVGSLNPLTEIAEVCRDKNVLLHSDATQAVGRLKVCPAEMGVDLLSLSAHKIYGPKGIGALYVRSGSPRIRIDPLVHGGGHERRLRSGTLAVPLIVGFGEACGIATRRLPSEPAKISALRDQFLTMLIERIDRVTVNGSLEHRLCGNAHLSITDVNSEALLMQLNNILCLSTGSACTTANPEPSHVLTAMGIGLDQIKASIRVGFGRFNTEEDVAVAVDAIATAVEKLRKFRTCSSS